MRACIYARKSTHKRGQSETIQNQIERCERKAKELEMMITDIKQDVGTGTDELNRPEVQQLLVDARNGKFDCVIIKGISRLYRDTANGLNLIKELDRCKVRVITCEESFDSLTDRTSNNKLDLSKITMYLMFAEMESKKLGDRIKQSQETKAYRGEWNQASNPPFGYKYNPSTKKLEIDYATCEIVKLIFDSYLKGDGMRSIMLYLNGDNPENKKFTPPKNSDKWNQYSIGYILRNQAYVGDVVYNKRTKTEKYYKQPELLGKNDNDIYVGNNLNEKDKWVITKNAHEAIISREDFEKVQLMVDTKSNRKGIRNNVSLLTGLAKCKECGASLTFKRGRKNERGWVVTKDNYYCMNYIKYGNQLCSSHHIGAKDLEKMVIDEVEKYLTNDQLLKKSFDEAKKLVPSNNVNVKNKKKNIEFEINKIISLMDKLLEKNLNGDITDIQFKKMNEKYSEQLSALNSQLVECENTIAQSTELEDHELFFRRTLRQFKSFENKTKEEIRHLLLNLVSSIVVDKDLKVKITMKFFV